MSDKPTAPQKARKTGKSGAKTTAGEMVSPLNGARCPTGAHPGNTGGKPGRSGRKPDAIREALRGIIDEDGLTLIQGVIRGSAPFVTECPKCGHSELAGGDLPTTDNRLRAFAEAAKFGLGERSEFSVDVVEDNLDRTLALAETLLEADDFQRFARQVGAIWNEEARG